MKIISYYIKGNNIYLKTDNDNMPDFTYPSDKFPTMAKLKREIEKKMEITKVKKDKKDKKFKQLKKDLDKEIQ